MSRRWLLDMHTLNETISWSWQSLKMIASFKSKMFRTSYPSTAVQMSFHLDIFHSIIQFDLKCASQLAVTPLMCNDNMRYRLWALLLSLECLNALTCSGYLHTMLLFWMKDIQDRLSCSFLLFPFEIANEKQLHMKICGQEMFFCMHQHHLICNI